MCQASANVVDSSSSPSQTLPLICTRTCWDRSIGPAISGLFQRVVEHAMAHEDVFYYKGTLHICFHSDHWVYYFRKFIYRLRIMYSNTWGQYIFLELTIYSLDSFRIGFPWIQICKWILDTVFWYLKCFYFFYLVNLADKSNQLYLLKQITKQSNSI